LKLFVIHTLIHIKDGLEQRLQPTALKPRPHQQQSRGNIVE